MISDKTLECRDCKKQFAFTASEQEFFAQRGYTSDPGRCPECREVRRARNGTPPEYATTYRSQRQTHTATCSDCGSIAEVPFVPNGSKPVYCRDCFAKRRA